MSSTAVGGRAEQLVAEGLTKAGYRLIDQNWRTRWCEVDLVMTRGDCAYLIEVKYRTKSDWGLALDYITATKLRQMKFAAEYWAVVRDWQGDVRLAIAAVASTELTITAI